MGGDVGLDVGFDVGIWVGLSVGVSVGVSVGTLVGVLVGRSVGLLVGFWVGILVGLFVGFFVGFLVGLFVGRLLGFGVRDTRVGLLVDLLLVGTDILLPPLDDLVLALSPFVDDLDDLDDLDVLLWLLADVVSLLTLFDDLVAASLLPLFADFALLLLPLDVLEPGVGLLDDVRPVDLSALEAAFPEDSVEPSLVLDCLEPWPVPDEPFDLPALDDLEASAFPLSVC